MLLGLIILACSTKKNTFVSRNSHALSTKYNILYNGGLALDKGIVDLKSQYQDNFWELLPIERMQILEDKDLTKQATNPDFERAEEKSVKAIQKHSMNIQGSEKNPQMDEAYLMLGKSRYYDQRFVPALDAFNYVLHKYPKSNKIYEVKIWREKTNMRLENDGIAVNNLRKLLKEIKFKDQIYSDANATLAQAFLNLGQKDSAVAKLKIARDFTKSNEEVSRYHFIIAQIYEQLGFKDSAFTSYQSVIDMKRKAARQYVIHAHKRQAFLEGQSEKDSIAFLTRFNDLIEDRENRPFLDVLHHQMGLHYEKAGNHKNATKHYNISLKKKTQDQYLIASNYRNLADINFIDSKFVTAGQYYDSTLIHLKPRTREYNAIKKKRENLDDVIKYEKIANDNDSILSLYNMSDDQKKKYFEDYIVKLKKEDEALALKAVKDAEKAQKEQESIGAIDGKDPKAKAPNKQIGLAQVTSKSSNFYFYNASTLQKGKLEFAKIWGKIKPTDNWRVASKAAKNQSGIVEEAIKDDLEDKTEKENDTNTLEKDDRYTSEFYIKQIPTQTKVIDSLAKDRNFAYYQLGIIYKEKFKEYLLAINRLEKLLAFNPEERLILPSMYNLYKLYQIINKTKAEEIKAIIIAEYPNSRYAQILQNPNTEIELGNDSPEKVYQNLYKQYNNADYKAVLHNTEEAIERFNGDPIMPKLELLKAQITGKLNGLDAYEISLNSVALSYPNVEEGKEAEKMLQINIPKLKALQLGKYPSKNWKILYQTQNFDDKSTKFLLEKLNSFITGRSLDKLSFSKDIYTLTDNFVVIHGLKSEEYAKNIVSILKEFKEYKVPNEAIIISSENYVIVQVKKNLEEYLKGNLPDNPEQPNWDGSYEKPLVVQQEKPNQTEQKQGIQEQKEQIKNKSNSVQPAGKLNNVQENEGMSLPPMPGGGASKKG